MAQPTEDVTATLTWLDEAGFVVVERWGGEAAPFGDVAWRYQRVDGTEVRIGSDRGQWSAHVRPSGADDWFDLGLAMAARRVEVVTDQAPDNPYEIKQLPYGVCWRDHLPATIDWLSSTPTATELLQRAREAAHAARLQWEALAARPAEEVAAMQDASNRDYYRRQHAKRHAKRRRPTTGETE